MPFRKSTLWKIAKQRFIDPVRRVSASVHHRNKIPLAWCSGLNWGDALSPVLVHALSGKVVVHTDGLHLYRFLAVGSILGSANEQAEVWGSGFICENATVIGTPRKIHAVRGPLSRASLLAQGIECPAVFGDPALLLPRLYNPTVGKRYSVGIVPHYVDKSHPWLASFRNDPQVRILDIESGITDFVQAIKSCEVILSSSLHGLICADAYGVPNGWIQLSDDVIGGDFKFRDYRHSTGAGEPACLSITDSTKLSDAVEYAEFHELKIDLKKLLLACPFLSDALRHEIINAQAQTCGLPEVLMSAKIETSEGIS